MTGTIPSLVATQISTGTYRRAAGRRPTRSRPVLWPVAAVLILAAAVTKVVLMLAEVFA
jgi:hypothetical protein